MSKYEVRTMQSDSTLTFSGIKCQGYKDRLKRHTYVRQTRMWANAQCDGRPAEYRWRPLFNAAVWLTPNTGVPCNNAAKARKPLKLAGVPQTNGPISADSRPSSPYCGDIWRIYCCVTVFFPIVDACLSCEGIARQSCTMVRRWRFFASCIFSEPRVARFRPAS